MGLNLSSKQNIRTGIRHLQRVKTWQLVVLLILMSFVAATFLRLNNIGMIERRSAVLAADEHGDTEQLQKRVYDLQRYSSTHMNASPGRIALSNQYDRDASKIKAAAEKAGDSNPNGNIYKKAAAVCDPIGQAQGWRWPDPRYTECVDKQLSKYPEANGVTKTVQLPDPSLYYHNFVSPLWTPDFAGFSILVCVAILIIIITRLLMLTALNLLLKRHYSSI